MWNVKIVADSINPQGNRLTTFEVTYPLIIHNEVMTHRKLSRNTASNRAIPVEKLIQSVIDNPFIPEKWPLNQKGMQNDMWITNEEIKLACINRWLQARDAAVQQARYLQALHVHKQITNRLLGPFLWTTAILSATDWRNLFNQRCSPMAQPEMQKLAGLMFLAYIRNTPKPLKRGQWHTPYVSGDVLGGIPIDDTIAIIEVLNSQISHYNLMVSSGRCARVSYLNHGENNTPDNDDALALRLVESGHWSPFEHIATPLLVNDFEFLQGNFTGWAQFRKFFPNENREDFITFDADEFESIYGPIIDAVYEGDINTRRAAFREDFERELNR